MKIGIDCRNILHPDAGESAGIGHYVHHLVAALLKKDVTNEYVLFFDNHDVAAAKHELLRGNPRVTARVLPFRTIRRVMPFIYRHLVVASVFEREKLDLLHGPANVVPLFYRRPWVVTVHDLAIYDHPEWFPPGSLGTQRFSTAVLVPHSVKHARRVIAVSQTTANDIARIFGLDKSKIDVVHEGNEIVAPGHDQAEVFARHGLKKGEYFLFLGTVEPRKNVATAIRAFVAAAKNGWIPDRAQFIIAGGRGWKNAGVFAEMREANDVFGSERVRYLGYVPAVEKSSLIGGAAAFVFPSHYEGFGLPVLEAMSLGTPVIASSTPALAEVCGSAALLVPPTDVDGFAQAFRDVWNDAALKEKLSRSGIERGREFTWQRAARETVSVYKRATTEAVSATGHDAS